MELIDKKKFEALPANKKRKAICKDVLKRLKIGLIVPENGRFFRELDSFERVGKPQKTFNKEVCHVCAKGAIMCSWVGNFNKYDWSEVLDFSEETSYGYYPQELLEIFGREMLDNIEAAFERDSFPWHANRKLSRKYTKNNFQGMKEIMKYIVANDGEFPVPTY